MKTYHPTAGNGWQKVCLKKDKVFILSRHSPARKSLNPATYGLNTLHKTVNNGVLIRLENLTGACEQWSCAKQRWGRKAAHREPKVQSRSHGLSGSVGRRYEVAKIDESTHLRWCLKIKHAKINSILQNVRNVTWHWSLLYLLWILWFSYSFCYYKTQIIRKKDINYWRHQNF